MQKSRIQVQGSEISISITPETVYRHGLAHYEREQAAQGRNAFGDEPGLVAIAEEVDYASSDMASAKGGFDGKPIGERIEATRAYMDDVAETLGVAGRVSGILDNGGITACTPKKATQRQLQTWNGGQGDKALFSVSGLVGLLKACVGRSFELPGGVTKSGGEILRNAYAQVGAPTANAWGTLLAMAEEGSLTEGTFRAVFEALHQETARFAELPEQAITAVRKCRSSASDGSRPELRA